MRWNIGNMVMITIKTFDVNQLLSLDNPGGVDMLLNKWIKPIIIIIIIWSLYNSR